MEHKKLNSLLYGYRYKLQLKAMYKRTIRNPVERTYSLYREVLCAIHPLSVIENKKDKSGYRDGIIYNFIKQGNEFRTRTEANAISIFSNSKEELYKVGIDLDREYNSIAKCTWYELEEDIKLDEIIMSEKLKGWEYRVTLKGRMSPDMMQWLKTNIDNIKCGKKTRNAICNGKYFNMNNRYVYVKNHQTITLMKMVSNNNIRNVKKVIIR